MLLVFFVRKNKRQLAMRRGLEFIMYFMIHKELILYFPCYFTQNLAVNMIVMAVRPLPLFPPKNCKVAKVASVPCQLTQASHTDTCVCARSCLFVRPFATRVCHGGCCALLMTTTHSTANPRRVHLPNTIGVPNHGLIRSCAGATAQP